MKHDEDWESQLGNIDRVTMMDCPQSKVADCAQRVKFEFVRVGVAEIDEYGVCRAALGCWARVSIKQMLLGI